MRVQVVSKNVCKSIYTSGIYRIVNSVNGKCYVGSSRNIGKRWSAHIRNLESGKHHSKHLQNSFNVHGKSKFSIAILEYVSDLSTLIVREQHWIDKLKPAYNGVQLAITGNRKLTCEQRQRVADLGRSFKGTKRRPETIARMKAAKAGTKIPHEQSVRASKAAAEKARGKRRDPAIVEKVAATRKSHKIACPEHVKEAVRRANTGRKLTADQLARRKAVRLTDAHKKKISEGVMASRKLTAGLNWSVVEGPKC